MRPRRRPERIRTSVLRWIYNNDHLQPSALRYLSAPDSRVCGRRVTRDELRSALAILEPQGLVIGSNHSFGELLPQIVRITGRGREVVESPQRGFWWRLAHIGKAAWLVIGGTATIFGGVIRGLTYFHH